MKSLWGESFQTSRWITWACIATLLVIFFGLWCAPLPASTALVPTNSEIIENDRLYAVPVAVTAYTSRPEETDDTPHITASNTWAKPGTVALSRDLLERYTPGAPFRFGDTIVLEGLGVFRVEDTMNPRAVRRVDIWYADLPAAQAFGVKTRIMTGPYGPMED